MCLVGYNPPMAIQRSLFCPCGAAKATGADFCRVCQIHIRYSKRRFGGHREAVLLRDRRLCQSCGDTDFNPRRIHVHHRRPGEHTLEGLVTLCAACHARVHRLRSVYHYLPPPLIPLWVEQHPDAPVQLQLELLAGVEEGNH